VAQREEFLDVPLADLLERFAAARPDPGGGSAAGLTVAVAAAVVTMAARVSSDYWNGARGALAQAKRLKERATPLAQTDAAAYAVALAALYGPKQADSDTRNAELATALEHAAEVPLTIAETAADVAELAAVVAAQGDPARHADAVTAGLLAAAAAAGAAECVADGFALIWLKSGGRLVLRGAAGVLAHMHGGLRTDFAVGEGLIGHVALSRSLSFVDEPAADPRTGQPDFLRREGVRAFIGVPLASRHGLEGVLGVFSRQAVRPDADTLDALGALAGQPPEAR
jgi:formiminotetrahydrofolate cyclodeaminase